MNRIRILALAVVALGFQTQAVRSETLADQSPFLPCGPASGRGAAPGAEALELRGVMSGPAGYLFYVYDPKAKRGVWAGRGDTDNPFTIVAEDASADTLEIRMTDGRRLHLTLREARITASSGESPASPAAYVADGAANRRRLTAEQAAWREEVKRRMAENAAGNSN